MRGRIVLVDSGWFATNIAGTGGGALDLLEVKLASTQFAFILSAKICQSSEETASNVAEIKAAIKRGSGSYTSGSSSGGSGGNAITTKGGTDQPSVGFASALYNNKVQATAGSGALEVLLPGTVNVRAGEWENTYIPELAPYLLPSQGVILSLDETNNENITYRAMLQLEVFGP